MLDGVMVNGKGIALGTKQVIIDTGAPLIFADPTSIVNIHAQIPGAFQVTRSYWMCTFVAELTVRAAN